MKKILKIIPFVAVLILLLGSVAIAKMIHSKKAGTFHVNTGLDKNGEIHTVRVFDTISSVLIIDMNNHSKNEKSIRTNIFMMIRPQSLRLKIRSRLTIL